MRLVCEDGEGEGMKEELKIFHAVMIPFFYVSAMYSMSKRIIM